jgi:hypothetical protein
VVVSYREAVTFSVFILSGSELKATIAIDGPLADISSINSGADLQKASDAFAYQHSESDRSVAYSATVDFEHLKDEFSEDDDDEALHHAKPTPDEEKIDDKDPEAARKRRERRDNQRKAFLAAKEKREKQKALIQKKIREDGEPVQHTLRAPVAGWYRACVQGTWYQVGTVAPLRNAA